ncbi:unnamed protein product [Fusarium graminearum]|uniref:Chromosome 1, complete genome n=1 Tax=Gibberella zeae (strain ATCC MYA-4620 / CBS 123657 / FGSC 9075 / NRRL 31084 / PH-1) TaxID=229533 RepID=I1SA07_GIBZE|nr:hypothetical protein FGSG_13688 [Fusarium graminearum PH-1]ESU16666.1 hypothetical protein FGSG_13688 [Fusarium graminearum PH-1]CEF75331.1 unnamed protein product [Fusarium graminearum]CZS78610.1 unnamed protein product [Fusarium graminearum]|eukprot:XP_011318928.1 hypothetical protein FGSG_13688 [Fusarium graminearum PH-1]
MTVTAINSSDGWTEPADLGNCPCFVLLGRIDSRYYQLCYKVVLFGCGFGFPSSLLNHVYFQAPLSNFLQVLIQWVIGNLALTWALMKRKGMGQFLDPRIILVVIHDRSGHRVCRIPR